MSIKQPCARPTKTDIANPSLEDLYDLALSRIRHIVNDHAGDAPPVLFPLAESMRRDFFTHEDWDTFGNLETEHSRLAYTLTRYPERGPPAVSDQTLRHLLSQKDILHQWSRVAQLLKTQANATLRKIAEKLHDGTRTQRRRSKHDFVTVPHDYASSNSSSELSLQLWQSALAQMARNLARGDPKYGNQFLEIHAYLKDPIQGLSKTSKLQLFFFSQLLKDIQSSTGTSIALPILERVVAQAAQESSFLANPLLEHTILVHFQAHHQLPYTNVPLDSLARAEFSVPRHVLEVAEEMLMAVTANDGQDCPLVPILVTTSPKFTNEKEIVVPIVDGNHRATAALFLRFVANELCLLNQDFASQQLGSYCVKHGLGEKWQIDLLDVLTEFYEPEHHVFYDYVMANSNTVKKFATVENIPALIVQEENFHTICKQRSAGKPEPVLLHPFHQALFNDDDLPFALPQKAGQTHGRPDGFRLLPLTPFGTTHGQQDEDTASLKEFKAPVRPSMTGLTAEEPFEPASIVKNQSTGMQSHELVAN